MDRCTSPCIVGLNNIKANDYCNAVLQALTLVNPLRNDFSRGEENCRTSQSMYKYQEILSKLLYREVKRGFSSLSREKSDRFFCLWFLIALD
ncbi:unnamed protein product [Phyllotreta striolata]|uniref:Peptidase C19 ubiquitin carboxyl-terminal hydrolase domain-containing protein n=1 Tax=Phyllotreta striolata TaxID=444603 RepID=A0A9N9XRI6_PHYSR|nr:unnamed protein product [Phyllotreta striolata]